MMPFQELLKRPLIIYLTHFGTFFKIILVSLVFNVAMSIIPAPQNLALTLKLTIPLTLISILLTSFSELALVRTFFGCTQNETPSTGRALTAALKKLPGFIPILVVWFLAVTVGIILLIVPGIIFATWFLFLSSVYMIEETSVLETFRRSKNLVSPHFVSIFWRAALTSALFFTILWTANQGIQFILELLKVEAQYPTLSHTIANGAGAALGPLLLPVYIGVMVTMYLEVRNTSKPL